jgi:hypothetical protein
MLLVYISRTVLNCFWCNSPQWARASSFTRFLDHTQLRTTVGRTPLDEGIYSYLSKIGSEIHSFHLVVCLTAGPKPLPKRALHIVRSRTSSLKWEYNLLWLRSSSSFLRLFPITSVLSFIFPSILVVEGSFYAKCDQSSSPSVYILHVGYSSAPWLQVIHLHFSHNQSNWSFPSFSSRVWNINF